MSLISLVYYILECGFLQTILDISVGIYITKGRQFQGNIKEGFSSKTLLYLNLVVC
jgi:hypothetical protein